MDLTNVWLLASLLIGHISFITTTYYVSDYTKLISLYKPFYTKTSYDSSEPKSKNILSQNNNFEVDLLQLSRIDYVILSNIDNVDNNTNGFRNISMFIGDKEYTNWDKCADYVGSSKYLKKENMFGCNGMGQYIRIEIFHYDNFQFLEVDVDVFGHQYGEDMVSLYNISALFIDTIVEERSSPGVIGFIDTKFKPLLSWRNFWKVNLIKEYDIKYIILHNNYTENEYSGNVLNNNDFKIAVYTENKHQENSTRCAYSDWFVNKSRAQYKLICKGIGQFLRVEKSQSSHFQLGKVDVFVLEYDDTKNISLKEIVMPHVQRCTKSGKCFHAVSIDLRRLCTISHIIHSCNYNYSHRSSDVLPKVNVYIKALKHDKWDKCAEHQVYGKQFNLKYTIRNRTFEQRLDCKGFGRYVRIKVFDSGLFNNQVFDVFGYDFEKNRLLLYNKSASYINTLYDANRNINTNLKIHNHSNNYWKVDLNKEFKIRYVKLHNDHADTRFRTSTKILEIAIFLENGKQTHSRICAHYTASTKVKPKQSYYFICEGIGQYVYVEHFQNGPFHLQEIEIYGFLYHDDAVGLNFLASGKRYVVINRFTQFTFAYLILEVNLLRMYKISYVLLVNIGDYNEMEYPNKNVEVAGKEYNNWEICSYVAGPVEDLVSYYIPCVKIAQYIRIDKSHFVSIYGYNIDNVILLSFQKPTLMKTTYKNDMSVYGVDGNINTKFKTAYHDSNNYWKVNLRKVFKIVYVTIYADHSKETDIGDFRKISIAMSSFYHETTCNYDEPGEKSRTIYRIICEGFGKYVRIDRASRGYLTLQEVEVYGINDDATLLSKGKLTYMSSAADEKQYDSSYGVDGRNDTKFKTSKSQYNNWTVVLEKIYKISHIILTNVDTYENDSDGLRNVSIFIGARYNNWTKCAYYEGPGEKSVKYWFACEGVAQFIRIDKSHFGHFQLQEVEIFGYDINATLISFSKTTFMKTTYGYKLSSKYGVDHNYMTKFRTLYSNSYNWWAVDFYFLVNISYISLYTVKHPECIELCDLRNMSIYISEVKYYILERDRCAYFGGPEDPSKRILDLICEGIGRIVRVVKAYRGYLELNEVAVYGIPIQPSKVG